MFRKGEGWARGSLGDRDRYWAIMLSFVAVLSFSCRAVEARAAADVPFSHVAVRLCGRVSGILGIIRSQIAAALPAQESDGLYGTLHEEVQETYMYCRRILRTEYYSRFLRGTWEIREFADTGVECTGGGVDEEEENAHVEYMKQKFLGMRFTLRQENIIPRDLGGFFFEDYADLFAALRQPPSLGAEPPYVGAVLLPDEWETGVNAEWIFIDSNGKAYVQIRGCFFRIERIGAESADDALYLWEEWADKDHPWYPR